MERANGGESLTQKNIGSRDTNAFTIDIDDSMTKFLK